MEGGALTGHPGSQRSLGEHEGSAVLWRSLPRLCRLTAATGPAAAGEASGLRDPRTQFPHWQRCGWGFGPFRAVGRLSSPLTACSLLVP